MKIIWNSGDGAGHRRSRGTRSDPVKRGRSGTHGSRRNPFLTPEKAQDSPRRNHRKPKDPLAPIGEELAEAGKAEHSARRRRKPHSDSADKTASVKKAPVGLTHIGFLLVGLALGAILLTSMNHLYSLMGRTEEEKHEAVATAQVIPEPPPAVIPKVVQQATEPAQALKLMLTAAAKGDVTTAYAQWDIAPEDLATVKRGQEMTLSDVVAKAKASSGTPHDQQFRVISYSEAEARVGQFRRGLCVQVFSLRKQGPYWKLYNASTP
ncbi:MAG: hypothetical protein ACYC63_15765 [Armatimonadota bacterium]